MRGLRSGVALAAAATAVAVLAGSLPGGQGAAAAPGDGSARSQAAAVTQGAGLTLTSKVSLVGLPVVDAITGPLTTQVINPLINGIAALPDAVTSGLVGALVNSGLSAQNGTDGQQPRPTSGYPDCGKRGWDSSNCYGPLAPATNTPAVGLSTGAVQGYATGDSAGYIAAARVANPTLTVLGFPLGDLGVVSSTASCRTTAASCVATQSATGGSLLRGNLALSIADGGGLIAKIGGATVTPVAVPVTVPGYATTVRADGNLATITVGMTLTQLLTAINLPTLLTSFTGGLITDDGTAVTLTIKIGPGALSQTSPASAWGMNVSMDLSVAVKLRVAGLATATVTSTSTPPSLAELKLAFSSATAGNSQPGWIPPAII